MKKITVTTIILAAFIYIVLLFSGTLSLLSMLPQRIAAQTIPQYPKAESWKIISQGAGLDNPSYTGISFRTEDRASSIMEFYRKELPKTGWLEIDYKKETPPGFAESYEVSFAKEFLLQNITISIRKEEQLSKSESQPLEFTKNVSISFR